MECAIDFEKQGLAGQVVIGATTTDNHSTVFYGSIYGGPVFMDIGWGQIRVDDPERFGMFGDDPKAWVAKFYATCESE